MSRGGGGNCGEGCFAAVFLGGAAQHLMENFSEITDGTETAKAADLLNGGAAFQQHIGSGADTVLIQIINGGLMETSLKTAGTFSLTDKSRIGNVFQGDMPGIIAVNKMKHVLDPGDITAAGDRLGLLCLGHGQQAAPELTQLVLQLELITERFFLRQIYHGVQRFQHPELVLVGGLNGLQLDSVTFCNGVDVLLVHTADKIAYQEAAVKNVGIDHAGTGGSFAVHMQDTGVDKHRFPFLQMEAAVRRAAFQRTLCHICYLKIAVPVPGDGAVHTVIQGLTDADVG